jgi:hypothetical protein
MVPFLLTAVRPRRFATSVALVLAVAVFASGLLSQTPDPASAAAALTGPRLRVHPL